MPIFDILKHGSSTLNFNSSDNIARIIKCDISKSKLALSTCNGVYFSSTALIVFTLYEIKQVKIFFGTPGSTSDVCEFCQNWTRRRGESNLAKFSNITSTINP